MAVLFAGIADANPVMSKKMKDCMVNHLQNVGFLDSSSEKVEPSRYCQLVVDEFQKACIDYSREKFVDFAKNSKKIIECTIKILKERHVCNYFMEAAVYENDLISGLTDEIKKKKIADNHKDVMNILSNIEYLCKVEKFNNLFDEFTKEDEDGKEDLPLDYCTKNYVIKNNLVDPVLYRINPNPKNIDVTNIDCDSKDSFSKLILNLIMDEFIKDENISEAECAKEKYQENNFMNQTILITVLKDLNLNDQQLAEFRNTYLEMGTKINDDLTKC